MQESPVSHSEKHSPRHAAAAVVLLVLVWAVLCFHVVLKADQGLYLSSSDDDALVEYWMSWWANKALSSDHDTLFQCPLINYPKGLEVFTFSPTYYHVILSGLIRDWAGPTGSINLVFAAALLFSIFCTWLFLRRLIPSPVFAAVLSSLPAIFLTLDPRGYLDLERANYGFCFLSLWLWLGLIEKGGWKRAILVGLAVGVTASALMYYGVCVIGLLVLGLVAPVVGIRPLPKSHQKAPLLTVLALGIGIGATLLVHWRTLRFFTEYGPYQREILTALESYVSPFTLAALILPAILAILCRKNDSTAWFWFLATALLLLLAIDPFLDLKGVRYEFPTPFMVMKRIVPFFWRLNSPHRFGWMAIIPLIALLARSGFCLSTRFSLSIKRATGLMAGLFLLGNALAALMSGYAQTGNCLSLILPPLKPIPIEPMPPVPASILEKMKKSGTPAAVFDVACRKEQWSAYYQTYHEQPIAGTGIVPPQFAAKEVQSDLTGFLAGLCDSLHHADEVDLPGKEWFQIRKVRYAILHTGTPEMAGLALYWESVYGTPMYSDEIVRIYDLTGP